MADNEALKYHSRHLRGTIAQALASDTSHFSDDDEKIVKFHGMYAEEDRDERIARIKAKQEPKHILMVRTKIPGGDLTGAQYLALDRFCHEFGNGTLRITSRQDIQFHGVLKKNATALVKGIN